jgi:hypothetical protein
MTARLQTLIHPHEGMGVYECIEYVGIEYAGIEYEVPESSVIGEEEFVRSAIDDELGDMSL